MAQSKSLSDWVMDLIDPEAREMALLELSKQREKFPELAPYLWNSFGTMAVLLQVCCLDTTLRVLQQPCACLSHARTYKYFASSRLTHHQPPCVSPISVLSWKSTQQRRCQKYPANSTSRLNPRQPKTALPRSTAARHPVSYTHLTLPTTPYV